MVSNAPSWRFCGGQSVQYDVGRQKVTIAINLKVMDGLVLAADSASTLIARIGDNPPFVQNVYNNANKIFNLRKGLPIGLITWGSGAIGSSSIATLTKILRARLSGRDADHAAWHLDAENYEILAISNQVRQFFYEEHYQAAFAAWPEKPLLGFVVAGYSSASVTPEEYTIQIDTHGNCHGPIALRQPEQVGVTWNGFPEPLTRLMLGFSANLLPLLQSEMPEHQAAVAAAFGRVSGQLVAPLVQAAMPLQDAIDLAAYLAEIVVKFSSFAPGAPVVGGPIEVAAITKYEGFKWVKRKYYYDREFNPTQEEDGHG